MMTVNLESKQGRMELNWLCGLETLISFLLWPSFWRSHMTSQSKQVYYLNFLSAYKWVWVKSSVAKFKYITFSCLLRIKKGTSTSLEWLKLYHSLDAGLQMVREICTFIEDVSRVHADRTYLNVMIFGLPIQELLNVFDALERSVRSSQNFTFL